MRKLVDVVFEQRPLILHCSVPVAEACRRMRDRSVGSVAVVDDENRLVGIFTGRDAVCRVMACGRDAEATVLADVMTRDPASMSPDHSAIDALRLMWDGGFRHVPLVKHGKVMGVVSRGDFKGFEHSRHETERDLWEHIR
jgi:CBS domain-containing protein